MSEFGEEPDATRRELLNNIHELRYNRANVMNGVRAYIAFRGERSLNKIELYLQATDANVGRLADASGSMRASVDDTGQMIRLMSDSVGLMNEMVVQIAHAAREQSQTSAEIAHNVEVLSGKGIENAEWRKASSEDLMELTETSARLNQVVGHFRV